MGVIIGRKLQSGIEVGHPLPGVCYSDAAVDGVGSLEDADAILLDAEVPLPPLHGLVIKLLPDVLLPVRILPDDIQLELPLQVLNLLPLRESLRLGVIWLDLEVLRYDEILHACDRGLGGVVEALSALAEEAERDDLLCVVLLKFDVVAFLGDLLDLTGVVGTILLINAITDRTGLEQLGIDQPQQLDIDRMQFLRVLIPEELQCRFLGLRVNAEDVSLEPFLLFLEVPSADSVGHLGFQDIGRENKLIVIRGEFHRSGFVREEDA